MQYLKNYLNRIRARGNEKLADSIQKTADDVGHRYIENFSFVSHEVGLLFGNIQSGKTGQMFGILCKAADLGFPVFLLLTTDNVVLQQQTLERVKTDLEGFCICGENDSKLFSDNNLMEPTIIVLKKNFRMLKLWSNIFNSTGFMKGNPLFIIDDEADAASLNTLVNRDKQSSINRYLDSIKNGSSSSLYLQVTGTPQAILLQTMVSGWHPYFTYYFEPGDTYLGGDFFFPSSKKPDCVEYNETVDNPMHSAVIRHLTVSAQMLSCGEKVANCLIHPSVRQAAHQRFADNVAEELNWCKDHLLSEFRTEFELEYSRILPMKSEKQSFETVWSMAKRILINNEIKILILNGKHDIDSEAYETGCNFIIGGNTLGRGVTFPKLQTIYYTRSSKKPQADTMWQHSRMFGYDRDPGLMKVYIDEHLYKLFADISATNNSIIAQIERNVENIKIYYPEGLAPTRQNVLDNRYVAVLSGGTNYYPYYPDNDSIENISKLLERFDENEASYQVSLRFIQEILSHVIPSPDFNLKAFNAILSTMIAEKPVSQGILIVRRNRNITQGTGALLSPNDWKLGGDIQDKVVLTMYQVTGTKGWHGKQLWIPNIKLPHNTMYYDVAEDAVE